MIHIFFSLMGNVKCCMKIIPLYVLVRAKKIDVSKGRNMAQETTKFDADANRVANMYKKGNVAEKISSSCILMAI